MYIQSPTHPPTPCTPHRTHLVDFHLDRLLIPRRAPVETINEWKNIPKLPDT